MRIRSVETTIVEIPFRDGGRGEGITPTTWRTLETVLVRVEDDDGVVGWGEGFGYFTADATKAMIDRNVAPFAVGATIDDVPAWNLMVQRRLHLFGRYGITLFALSGVDLALWDLRAKREGKPLRDLLGPGRRTSIPCYASLVRYGDDVIAPETCLRALADGFTDLKLHEITLRDIDACRDAVSAGVPISVDVNCNWDVADAHRMVAHLAEHGHSWVEEPIFPPEDFLVLASLRGRGIALAAGENWCTSVQFEAAANAGAVDVLQPSVTKVGGVSEFLRVAELASARGLGLVPHCPYFGPGLFTSLHLASALDVVGQLEYLYVEREATLADLGPIGPGGHVRVSDAPGNGFEPDPDVIRRYRRA
ncbi:mandelate racemase/muconate lactonizing enzyme family protein [soil metagenome]